MSVKNGTNTQPEKIAAAFADLQLCNRRNPFYDNASAQTLESYMTQKQEDAPYEEPDSNGVPYEPIAAESENVSYKKISNSAIEKKMTNGDFVHLTIVDFEESHVSKTTLHKDEVINHENYHFIDKLDEMAQSFFYNKLIKMGASPPPLMWSENTNKGREQQNVATQPSDHKRQPQKKNPIGFGNRRL